MKKSLYLLLLFITISRFSSGQEDKYWIGDTTQIRCIYFPSEALPDSDFYFKHDNPDKGTWVVIYWDKEMLHKRIEYKSWGDGNSTSWYRDGHINEKWVCVEIGKYHQYRDTAWYPDGMKKKNIIFEENRKLIVMYYPSGKVLEVHTYTKMDSAPPEGDGYVWRFNERWCENGNVIFHDSVWYYKPHLSISYYCNGNKKMEAIFCQGNRYDTSRRWYENGQLKEIGQFDDTTNVHGDIHEESKKQGKWSYYNENGKLVKEETYKDNALIEEKEY